MDLNHLQQQIQYKQKYYCEMCRKQCKDQNGFKCHCNTEHHKQMMKLLSENPQYFIEQFSEKFETSFLSLLKGKYLNTPVDAGKVYSQFAHDKYNVKLNSTKWTTLTSFIEHLAETNKCQITRHDKGFVLLCADHEKLLSKEKDEKEKETVRNKEKRRNEQKLRELLKKADELSAHKQAEIVKKPENFQNEPALDKNAKIEISLNTDKNENDDIFNFENLPKPVVKDPFLDKKGREFADYIKQKEEDSKNIPDKKREPEKEYWEIALDQIIQEKRKKDSENEDSKITKKEEKNPDDAWVMPNIIVKIIDKDVGNGKYYNKKGVILRVSNYYVAEVKLLDSEDIIKIDQSYLETVIPSIGSEVILLVGKYRGIKGIMKSLHIEEYKASIELKEENKTLKVAYEGFSKSK